MSIITFDLDEEGITSPKAIYVGGCVFLRSEIFAGVPVYKINGDSQGLERHCMFAIRCAMPRFLKQFYLTVNGRTIFLISENTVWYTVANFFRQEEQQK